MSVVLPRTSREFVYIEGITAWRGDDPAEPQGFPPQVAIIPADVPPVETDWVAAQWIDNTTVRFLFGPGGAAFREPGDYALWLRITGAVEQPERQVDTLIVT